MTEGLTAGSSLQVVPVESADGARCELMLVTPAEAPAAVVHWLPAMGVPARHYLPLADGLARHGIAMAIHEWRGIGSSDRRAGRRANWGYRELLALDLPASAAAVRARWSDLPVIIGGHSLGGQLGSVYASLHPSRVDGLLLVASGAPFWKAFPRGRLIRLAYAMAPHLADLCGYLPGRRMGFAGNEARGVIADWARSGRTGRYAAKGLGDDLESAMADLRLPAMALRLRDDWLVPSASLDWLLGKLPQVEVRREELGRDALAGRPADHFSWMKAPDAVVDRIADWMRQVRQHDRS